MDPRDKHEDDGWCWWHRPLEKSLHHNPLTPERHLVRIDGLAELAGVAVAGEDGGGDGGRGAAVADGLHARDAGIAPLGLARRQLEGEPLLGHDRKSTRLNSSH